MGIINDTEWDNFEAPYRTAFTELPNQLVRLLDCQTVEELEKLLYNEIASNLKHQFRIYNIVLPVIDYFDFLLSEGFSYKNEVLEFFGYIFLEFIRDENNLLVTPIKYQACSLKLKYEYPEEYSYYIKFKEFFKKNYKLQGNDSGIIIFYSAALLSNDSIMNDLNEVVSTTGKINNVNIALFGRGLVNFKSSTESNEKLLNVKVETNELTNIAYAFNVLRFNEASLNNSLKSENVNLEVFWGSGHESVLACVAYLVYSLGFKNNVKNIKLVIDLIFTTYSRLLNNYKDELEIEFPPHKFILEDVTCVLFKDFLGTGKVFGEEGMSEIQLYFFKKISKELRTHTYSLLYAGVLPLGMSLDEANQIEDIYLCYGLK